MKKLKLLFTSITICWLLPIILLMSKMPLTLHWSHKQVRENKKRERREKRKEKGKKRKEKREKRKEKREKRKEKREKRKEKRERRAKKMRKTRFSSHSLCLSIFYFLFYRDCGARNV